MADAAPKVRLGDIAHIQQGKTLPVKAMTGGPAPVYGANGIVGFYSSGHYGHAVVALGCRGSCGTVHIAPPGAFLANNVMAIWPRDDDIVSTEFLALALDAADLVAAGVVSGSVQPQITRTSLTPLEVPLPHPDQQALAVSLIEAIDDVRRLHADQVRSSRDARAALGSKLWVDHDARRALNDLGRPVTGKTPSTSVAAFWDSPDVGFFAPSDFGDRLFLNGAARTVSRAGAAHARLLPPNTLAQVCIGATIGKVGVLTEGGTTNQQVNAVIGLDDVDAAISALALNAPEGQEIVKRRAGKTTLPILKKSAWAQIEIPWPDREVREAITAVAVAMHEVELVNEAAASALAAIRRDVLPKLVSGRVNAAALGLLAAGVE